MARVAAAAWQSRILTTEVWTSLRTSTVNLLLGLGPGQDPALLGPGPCSEVSFGSDMVARRLLRVSHKSELLVLHPETLDNTSGITQAGFGV